MEKQHQWQQLSPDTDDLSGETKTNTPFIDNPSGLSDSAQGKYSFFIFSNPISGGNKALAFADLEVERMVFPCFKPYGVPVEANFYSLVDSESRNKGLSLLKRTLKDKNIEIRVIVGGGDGSIMWAIEEMIKAGITFERCPIGCIPFGTGNDLARVLGWGGEEPSEMVGKNLNSLKGLIRQWMDATPEDLDIWDVTIEVYEEGGIKKVHKAKGKNYEEKFLTTVDPMTRQEVRQGRYSRKMCNYFSFGIDAMTGYGFDKQRTSSRVLNKTVYCWEGFKRIFSSTGAIGRILHKVEEYKEPSHQHQHESVNSPDDPRGSIEQIDYSGRQFVIYPSGSNHETMGDGGSVIKGDPSVFLCLNVPSYMGGASNPWGASKGNVGVTDHLNKTLEDFQDQKFGDGKLEILSFGGPLELAMERFMPGRGKRIGQTEGPFQLNFKRSENSAKPLRTYMNIDGEYFKIIAPKCVRLTATKDVPRGKVKMLVRKGFRIA